MFDGPLPQDKPRWGRHPLRDAGLATLALTVLASAMVVFEARTTLAIVSSRSHLRQIEIVSDSPGLGKTVTKFYLHDAGYRLRHAPQLLATVQGAGNWSVTWDGPNAVDIFLAPGWTGTLAPQPAGMRIDFITRM